ncbi:hypothetical protein [Streptomyces sp. NPDC055036]
MGRLVVRPGRPGVDMKRSHELRAGPVEADALTGRPDELSVTPEADQGVTRVEQQDQEYVTCPRCKGRQGFETYRHVPHKRIGGLCYKCDGEGVIPVADATVFRRRQQATEDARRAREQARINERQAQEDAAHAAAFDRYGEEYRLVYALSRYDHPATLGAVIDLNAYRANDKASMRRVRDRLPYMVEAAGLDGLGLEEIEWLAAGGEPLPAEERGG